MSHVLGERGSGRRHSMCKDPKVRWCLVCGRNSEEARMAGTR